MKKIAILTALMLALILQPISAQRKRVRKAKHPVVELTEEEKMMQERIKRMENATQKVMVIDSLVIKKEELFNYLKLNPEVGTVDTYNRFFLSEEQPHAVVSVNEMKDKCYFSAQQNDGSMRLYTADFIGNNWTAPMPLAGIDTTYAQPNYPFMMTDGTTFYFAAMGSESIGGYDIFVTRYDADQGAFLTAENIGMPFNSTANDYMMVIDDLENIGWFVSDRNQSADNVCIYTFIPNDTRLTYDVNVIGEEQMKALATLSRIADTWGNGKKRKEALQRLQLLKERQQEKAQHQFDFVINDQTIYHRLSDFKTADTRQRYRQLEKQWNDIKRLENTLDRQRKTYAQGTTVEKEELHTVIIDNEQELEQLRQQALKDEKQLRNDENNAIGH